MKEETNTKELTLAKELYQLLNNSGDYDKNCIEYPYYACDDPTCILTTALRKYINECEGIYEEK